MGCSSEAASGNVGESHDKNSVKESCDQVTGTIRIKKNHVRKSCGYPLEHLVLEGVGTWLPPRVCILLRNMRSGRGGFGSKIWYIFFGHNEYYYI